MTLGAKRNRLYEMATGDILLHMDDDDYYPPTRIEHAVEVLEQHPHHLIAGCNQMHFYFLENSKVCLCGPYGPNHANCATFAFRRALLTQTHFQEEETFGEERAFLKNYTIPIAWLTPEKTILVICHEQNSCDKKEVVEGNGNPVQWLSPPQIDQLLRTLFPSTLPPSIEKFYLTEVAQALENYKLGDLIHKSPKLLVDLLQKKKQQLRIMEDFYQKRIQELEKELSCKTSIINSLLKKNI